MGSIPIAENWKCGDNKEGKRSFYIKKLTPLFSEVEVWYNRSKGNG
jgi:hypothetical protein